MKHKGTVTIESGRLLLRRFQLQDAASMFKNWASDKQVTRFLRWSAHSSIEETKDILTSWIQNYEQDNVYQWGIVLKDGNVLIGTIGVVEVHEDIKMAHIGYCIGQNWWNQGIMSEALRTVITYLFEEVGFNRIESQHDPENTHSGMVMRRCGMVYEGTRCQADHNQRGIVDAVMYRLLADEYQKKKEVI